MKRYVFLAAAVLIAAASCTKTYETVPVGEGMPIAMNTWNDVMTKAPLTSFAVNDVFDVFGYKWKGTEGSQTNPTTVFDGIDVKQTSADVWEYAGISGQTMRYWDASFAGYTFFAAFPNEQLATAPAQTGLFVSNSLTYDGANEKLLVAQKKTVLNASFGSTVPLLFKHTGALVDFQFKKHPDLEHSAVSVTAFSLANIRTTGTFEVASYNGSNDPVGATVGGVAGLGWAPDGTPTVNAAAAPYVLAATATSAADETANVDLLTNLVLMPQAFATGAGAQTFTIAYTITDEAGQTSTYTPAAIELKEFDKTDIDTDTTNNANFGAWMPGYHYTFVITINAKGIVFSASVDNWLTDTGHYYLIN